MNRKNARFIVSLLWKQPIQKEAEYAEGELYSDCHLYSESITISSLFFCFCFFFFSGFQPWLHVKISKILFPEILIKIICAVSQTWASFVASQIIPSRTMVDRHYLCAHSDNIFFPFHAAIKELEFISFIFSYLILSTVFIEIF